MFDERWSPDTIDVTAALRSLLEERCDEKVVRTTEQSEAGWSPDTDALLREFGLYDLDPNAEMLTAIAVELGRSLAPVAWPETAAVRAALDVDDAAYALDSTAPLGPTNAVVRADEGATLVPTEGPRARTGAGDVLVRVASTRGPAMYDKAQTRRLESMMRLLGAARIVGGARRLLEIGVDYAKERRAFGKPIGTYQAISHKLADAAIAVEGAELLVKKTAFLSDQSDAPGDPPFFFATMAWSNTVQVGRLVARDVHQCMGGFGATMEYPTQLYSRRIRSWALRIGRSATGYRELGRLVLDRAKRDEIAGLWHEDKGINIPRWVRDLDRLPNSSAR